MRLDWKKKFLSIYFSASIPATAKKELKLEFFFLEMKTKNSYLGSKLFLAVYTTGYEKIQKLLLAI